MIFTVCRSLTFVTGFFVFYFFGSIKIRIYGDELLLKVESYFKYWERKGTDLSVPF